MIGSLYGIALRVEESMIPVDFRAKEWFADQAPAICWVVEMLKNVDALIPRVFFELFAWKVIKTWRKYRKATWSGPSLLLDLNPRFKRVYYGRRFTRLQNETWYTKFCIELFEIVLSKLHMLFLPVVLVCFLPGSWETEVRTWPIVVFGGKDP